MKKQTTVTALYFCARIGEVLFAVAFLVFGHGSSGLLQDFFLHWAVPARFTAAVAASSGLTLQYRPGDWFQVCVFWDGRMPVSICCQS